MTNGESEPKPENGESTPSPDDGKKNKKEKVGLAPINSHFLYKSQLTLSSRSMMTILSLGSLGKRCRHIAVTWRMNYLQKRKS